jgi:hypothetical protein
VTAEIQLPLLTATANLPQHPLWLFTTIGFFSVVRKEGEQHLSIRVKARLQFDSDGPTSIVGRNAVSSTAVQSPI